MTNHRVHPEIADDGACMGHSAAWRCRLLARLAAERAELLWQLVGLGEEVLTGLPVFDDWMAKDLLAHVAAWDKVMTGRVEMILAGREEITLFTGVDEDARNALVHAERKGWSLQQAVDALVTARAEFLAALARLSDEEIHRLRRFLQGEASVREWAEWRGRHDAIHTADLVAWREERGWEGGVGSREILLAGLAATREALLAAAALVPPEERVSRLVCGEWTLKDVLGHVADWEWVGVEGLRDTAAGRAPCVGDVRDLDAWNQAHCEARRDQPWEEVWADLHAARGALLEILMGLSQDDLARSFVFPWGGKDTIHWWVCVYLVHDRTHAEGLRDVVGAQDAGR